MAASAIHETTVTVEQIVSATGGTLAAQLDKSMTVRTIASLADAESTDISWVDSKKWLATAQESKAAIIIGAPAVLGNDHPKALLVDDTQAAVANVLELFAPPADQPAVGVHPSAAVDETASIAATACIGAHVRIGPGAAVGEHAVIHAGVSVGAHAQIGAACELFDGVVVYERCTIGARVRIHANAVIGADGFGYIFRDGQHRKLKHIGTVVIEDDVEIGANTTIDRAKVGETRVGRGTKIDNLVMVAHNVQIGPACIIVGHVGLSGSVRLGAGCVLGGHVGVADGIYLADGTQVSAKSGIMNDVDTPGTRIFGIPAQEHTAAKRELLQVRRLPKALKRISDLEKKVAELEGAANDRETG